MKEQQITRRFFPAGNTTEGFYSYFDYMIDFETANHIYTIKGGPGTGKSSLMRKVAKHYHDLGFNIEYHHCSSDPDSLDGIVISELKVAMMDGTSPHVVDPKVPGVIDDLIDLSIYWDEAKLGRYRKEIIENSQRNKELFKRAYGYLKAAGKVYDVYRSTSLKAFKKEQLNEVIENLIKEMLGDYPVVNHLGNVRYLFGFGITPRGIVNFREDYMKGQEKWVLIKEDVFSSAGSIMHRLLDEVTRRGFDVICLKSPIDRNQITDLLVDDIGLTISVENPFQGFPQTHTHTSPHLIDLSEFTDTEIVKSLQPSVTDDLTVVHQLLDMSVKHIHKAKENHDVLEKFYVNAIDFSKHDDLANALIRKFEAYR